jgi:hypothetical protein
MIDIKSDREEIVKHQEIIVTIIPEAGTAIFKKHLLFSIDNPQVKIKQWKAQERAQVEYVQAFRKEKKIYINPVLIKLKITVLVRDEAVLQQEIDCSRLSISWLELCENGDVRPKHMFVPLTKHVLKNNEAATSVYQRQVLVSRVTESIESEVYDVESYNIKTLLICAMICFVIALICFFERSRRFITVQFIIGILLMCCALSFVTKILLIMQSWPFGGLF